MKKNLLLFILLFASIGSIAEAGRMYDPEIARFSTPDPALREHTPNEQLGLINGGLLSNNPYNYALNNPVKYVDPDGKLPVLAPAIPFIAKGLAVAYTALKATLITATTSAVVYTGYLAYEELSDNRLTTANPYTDQTIDQLGKSLKSYEDLLNEHTQKLEDYVHNPDAQDNRGSLKNAKNEQERESIIRGRVRVLETQIEKHKVEIEKIKNEIEKRSTKE